MPPFPAHWCPRVNEGVRVAVLLAEYLDAPEELCVVKHQDSAITLIILLNKKSVWGCQIDGFLKFDINSILLNLPLLLGFAF